MICRNSVLPLHRNHRDYSLSELIVRGFARSRHFIVKKRIQNASALVADCGGIVTKRFVSLVLGSGLAVAVVVMWAVTANSDVSEPHGTHEPVVIAFDELVSEVRNSYTPMETQWTGDMWSEFLQDRNDGGHPKYVEGYSTYGVKGNELSLYFSTPPAPDVQAFIDVLGDKYSVDVKVVPSVVNTVRMAEGAEAIREELFELDGFTQLNVHNDHQSFVVWFDSAVLVGPFDFERAEAIVRGEFGDHPVTFLDAPGSSLPGILFRG